MKAFGAMRRLIQPRPPLAPCIGVEFGNDALHLVQRADSGEALQLHAALTCPYPKNWAQVKSDKRLLRKFVDGALKQGAFAGKRVYAAMPASQVRIVPLSFRVPTGQSEAAAVWKSLQEKLRSDLSGDVVDYMPVKGLDASENETHVLATVARREEVLSHLRHLEDAGLAPQALEVGPASLSRLLSASRRSSQQSVLLLNFGAQRSYITIILGGQLSLDREVDLGEARMIEKVATSLRMEQAMAAQLMRKHGLYMTEEGQGNQDAELTRTISEILHPEFSMLAEEIGRTLVYIASRTRGRTPDCMYLHGSLAPYPGLASFMQRFVNIHVEVLHPFEMLGIQTPSGCNPDRGNTNGLALAMGLALRA